MLTAPTGSYLELVSDLAHISDQRLRRFSSGSCGLGGSTLIPLLGSTLRHLDYWCA